MHGDLDARVLARRGYVVLISERPKGAALLKHEGELVAAKRRRRIERDRLCDAPRFKFPAANRTFGISFSDRLAVRAFNRRVFIHMRASAHVHADAADQKQLKLGFLRLVVSGRSPR